MCKLFFYELAILKAVIFFSFFLPVGLTQAAGEAAASCHSFRCRDKGHVWSQVTEHHLQVLRLDRRSCCWCLWKLTGPLSLADLLVSHDWSLAASFCSLSYAEAHIRNCWHSEMFHSSKQNAGFPLYTDNKLFVCLYGHWLIAGLDVSTIQEPVKSRAPQLHLEYRFYKTLGTTGKVPALFVPPRGVFVWLHDNDSTVLEDQPRRLHHFHNKRLLRWGYVFIVNSF